MLRFVIYKNTKSLLLTNRFYFLIFNYDYLSANDHLLNIRKENLLVTFKGANRFSFHTFYKSSVPIKGSLLNIRKENLFVTSKVFVRFFIKTEYLFYFIFYH